MLVDGGAACFSPYLFSQAERKFDPLVNTMVGLVKKTKEGEIQYSIKSGVSPQNIKTSWSKCKDCVKSEYCHGFDSAYLYNKR